MKKKTLAVALLATCLAACGGSKDPDVGDRTLINFLGVYDTYSQGALIELVNAYNNGQGLTDKVYVNPKYNSGEYGQYLSDLAKSTKYSVVTIGNDQIKNIAIKDYLLRLDSVELMSEENKTRLSFDEMSPEVLNSFRMNGSKRNGNNKYESGEGQPLMGMPFSVNPHVLFYNSKILKDTAGMNIISVPEAELDAYNQEHSTNIQPHGYAEYLNAPWTGAKSSQNRAGETVYKVFNDCIPMNFEELRLVSYAMKKQYSYNYGFMSEWWFNFGFSVGGDCVGWNETSKNYEFTVTDKNDNWLCTKALTVNGTAYKKGQVLHYEDAMAVNNGEVDKAITDELYKMPSQYEAFKEFNRLGVPENSVCDGNDYGYGVAPNTTTNRAARFLTGTDCPFLIEEYGNVNSYKSSLKENLNIMPLPQYREYEGGSFTGNKETISGQQLKVIGKDYGGEVYTGALKKVQNDAAAVGELQGACRSLALSIPTKSDSAKYQAAMKFISWACGEAGQKIFTKANTSVPTISSLALSKEFTGSTERVVPNTYAASLESLHAEVGDYDYFQTRTWIDPWAAKLNVNVREGKMTLTEFINDTKTAADSALSMMTLRTYGR